MLNDVLLPAMKDVGDRFGAGELILPFVLQSAEVMKRAVAHLEQYLDRLEGQAKGKVVLATVFGDVHDIGKNLVNTILSQQRLHGVRPRPAGADERDHRQGGRGRAPTRSACRRCSCRRRSRCRSALHELDHRGAALPGAGRRRGDQPRVRPPDRVPRGRPRRTSRGVFYCKDAFEGLDADGAAERRRAARPAARRAARAGRGRAATRASPRRRPSRRPSGPAATTCARRRGARAAVPGRARCGGIDPDGGVRADGRSRSTSLVGRQGRARRGVGAAARRRLRPRRARMQARRSRRAGSSPRAVYGFFRGAADGDDAVVIFDADGGRARPVRVPAPGAARPAVHLRLLPPGRRRARRDRAPDRDGRPRGDGALDALQAAEEYSEAYFAHGLAIEAAEGLAESCTAGSWPSSASARAGPPLLVGLPGLPRPGAPRAGAATCSAPPRPRSASALRGVPVHPEQSTAAIVVHHPQAIYFSARRASAPAATTTGARHRYRYQAPRQ